MRRNFSRSAAALLLAGAAAVAATATPALAGTSHGSARPLAVRDLEPMPTFQLDSLPIAPSTLLASASEVVQVSQGTASWYGPGFFGNRTANGEVFRPGTLTAAHRTLPFGTRVRVTNLNNGRSTVVRINDRGPFTGNRVIDLGHGAAHEIGLVSSGLAPVRLEVLR
ncbi:septal ring lytic transglycosylase RlpA family protein [Cyanobium sp. ATX 6A2]|uniref:septal ring lytic transglycosylase RlpA family protein n=1 Tax=Cyanobium sp. ATX 6A2 TaxID=2823700 RepID=UPI0020CE0357|nr:septal ring lytic transglycosylase RlpA family protein [Cyanobium sp. ATX 6A2]MCP9887954.1 septal ring lytic transglycosylase RlpA family protein [Cyanobium sp. ATX 6A2]